MNGFTAAVMKTPRTAAHVPLRLGEATLFGRAELLLRRDLFTGERVEFGGLAFVKGRPAPCRKIGAEQQLRPTIIIRGAAVVLAASFLVAGCHVGSYLPASWSISTPAELEAAVARASELKKPLVVLVAEAEASRADDRAIAALNSEVKQQTNGVAFVLLDVSVSRTRATAARFHALETPVLLCLSSRGIVISRDGAPITRSLIEQRVSDAARQSPVTDEMLQSYAHMAAVGADAPSQLKLTDFLLAHHNAFEAIPKLEAVAHSDAAPAALRVRAWVDLARAHLWIGEAEKGRHEAEALMATLGTTTPEALAGGNVVLGVQDATAKRAALARTEFEAAVAAAPDSPYGRQASEALANLFKNGPQK
jgi:hypothetical protein